MKHAVSLLSILCGSVLVAGCAGTGTGVEESGGTSAVGAMSVQGFAARMAAAHSPEAVDKVAAEFSKSVAGQNEAGLEELKTIARQDKQLRSGALALLSRNLPASEYGKFLLQLPDRGQ